MMENIVIRMVKDPASALTHGLAFAATLLAAAPLLVRTAQHASDARSMIAMLIFLASMLLLYAASTVFHAVDVSERVNRILQKIDHIMIYVLIAGTYTPVCLLGLNSDIGIPLLLVVWVIAAAGMITNAIWITCPRWFSSTVYIAMGWACIFAFRQLMQQLPAGAFLWLLAGGLFYTAGGVIYALRRPEFDRRHPNFGMHEIFHLFVMAGSFCHYIVMFCYIA